MNGLHEEALPGGSAAVFERLGKQPEFAAFYLAGGTAAALLMGHRLSEDLDLFTERPWRWERMARAMAAAGDVEIDRQEDGTFVGLVSGVRVSLFEYPYVLLEEPVPTRFGIPVAQLLDIGCMKLVAVAQRGSRKHFVDLYCLGREGFTIRELMTALQRKMPAVTPNPVHVLRSLSYFEDAEAEAEPLMLVPFEWRQVREYCQRQADSLLAEVLGEER